MKKQNNFFRILTLSLAVASMISFASCSKKTKPDENTTPETPSPSADANLMGDSDSNKAMGLQTVHFPYDSFVLDDAAKETLKANAEILKGKASVKIQVEGHCDQRGGIQYNIALGEKRANATKRYLVDLGVTGDRITTISYGKERPADPATNDEAYAKNRRSNFVITSK